MATSLPLIFALALLVFLGIDARKNHNKKHHRHFHRHEMAEKRDFDTLNTKRTGIPDLLSMLGKETKDGTEYEAFGCKLTVHKDSCIFKFIPDAACKEKVSLGKLFELLLKQKKLQDIVKTFLPVGVFQIDSFILDKCIGDVELKTSAKESFDIVKEKLKVQKAVLEVKLNYKTLSTSPIFENLGLDITGEITIGGKSVPLELHKKKGDSDAKFKIKTSSINAEEFSKMFSKKEITDKDSPQKVGMFSKAVISNPTLLGCVDNKGSFEIVLNGAASGITGFGDIMLFVIAQKDAEGSVGIAMVSEIKAIQPTTILSSLTGKDLSKIPLFKDLRITVALEISNNDMMILKDLTLNKLLQNYISNAKTITKGTKIKLDIPIKEMVRKTGTKATLTHFPDNLLVKIFITNGKISCVFPDNVKMDLLNALVALIPNVPDAIFKKVLKNPPNIIIKTFDVDVNTQAVDLQMSSPDEVKLGNDLIALKDVEFDLSHKSEGSWNFKIKGAVKIGDGKLEVTVERKGENYELTGAIHSLTTKQVIEQFGGGDDSKQRSIITDMDFLNFGIKDVKITAVFEDNLKIRVTGNPILFGWDGMFFEGMILGSLLKRQMFLGIVMQNIRIDEVVEKLFKKKIMQVSWMSQLTATILVSNTDATTDVDFTLPELKKAMTLKKGVFFSTELTIPNDCKGSVLCEVAREKMKPGTKLRLEGDITTSGMILRAVYEGNGFEFGNNFKMTKLQAVLKVALETEFYFEGEMKIKDPALTFTARISVGITGRVELQLKMIGIWKRPFGLRYVAFGNIQMGVAIEPAVPIPKLEFTAEIQLGKIGNGKEIISKSAVSFDPSRPLDNYFYASINKLTLQSISEAFEFTISLPQVLLDTGFPEGLATGFTTNPKGKDIEHLKAKIPAGFMFRGLLNILGFKIRCDITVDFPKLIEVNAEFSPINIGNGMVAVRKSKDDLENGPQLYVKVSKEEVAVKIQGYVSLLGIGTGVKIDISNKGFEFYIYGKIFNLIEANVTVKAAYAKLSEAQFTVSSCISTSVKEVTQEAKETITTAADDTKEVTSETEKAVTSAGSWYESATARLEKWMAKLSEKETVVQRKAGKLAKIKDYLSDKCVDQCEDIYLGGPTIKKKCKKIGGIWWSCPDWDDRKWRIENPICIAKCKGKKLYLEGKALKKRVTMEILIDTISIIKKILAMVKSFVENSKSLIDSAENAFQKVGEVASAGKAALEAIAKYTRENLINVHYMCFNTKLEKASKTKCFELKVNVTLGGTKNFNIDTEGCLDGSFVKKIGKAIAAQLFPGIDAIKDKLKQMRDYMKDSEDKEKDLVKLDSDSKKEEEELEGVLTKNEKEMEDDDGDDNDKTLTQKHTLDKSFDEAHIRHQVFGPFPFVTIRDDVSMEAMDVRSPWAFSAHDSPFISTKEFDSKIEHDDEENTQKEDIPLDFDEIDDSGTSTSCKKINGTVKMYQMMSETLNLMSRKMENVKSNFAAQTRHFVQGLAKAEKEITYNCRISNMTKERTDDALFYVGKVKQGTAKWRRDVDQQIAKQDEKALGMWKEDLSGIAKGTKHKTAEALVEVLTSVASHAAKRQDVPSRFGTNMKTASEIINSLVQKQHGSLSSNKALFEKLSNSVDVMKEALSFIACTA